MKNCEHFKSEQVPFMPEETHPGSRDVFSKATTQINIWCSHEASPKMRDELSPLSCNGDKDKCPIK